ncbi:MAG: hypothetical protein ACK42Y_11590 [Candidatus Thermochlorobacter sp.]
MVFEFDILESESLVAIRVEGVGNFQKGLEHILQVANDYRFKPDFNILVDMCHLHYLPSLSEMRDFADVLISLKDKCSGKTALIVSNFLHFGLGKFLGNLLEVAGIKMQVFRTAHDAQRWFRA